MLGMTRRMAYRCSVCESSVCERSVFVSYFVRWGKKDPSPAPNKNILGSKGLGLARARAEDTIEPNFRPGKYM